MKTENKIHDLAFDFALQQLSYANNLEKIEHVINMLTRIVKTSQENI